jgi:hypothetical protein
MMLLGFAGLGLRVPAQGAHLARRQFVIFITESE